MRIPVLPVLLLAGLAQAERDSVGVRLKRVAAAEMRPRVMFPQARFGLSARRPASLKGFKPKKPLTKFARYGVARLGGRTLHMVFDAVGASPALGVLYSGGGKSTMGSARPHGKDGFTVDFGAADFGAGLACNVRLVYQRGRVTACAVESAYHRRGRAVLAGSVRDVILIDADADGKFNGPRDRWLAPRADKTGKMKTLHRPEALLLKEPQIPFEKDGRTVMVERVAEDGSTLLLVLDVPKTEVKTVLNRRYREVRADHFRDFDREMVTFIEEHGLDVTREAVDRPAGWRRMPLSKAKELAKKQKKPLLVSFFTESNPWCYRYEFYTFRDAAVDRLLRKFVRVRIDAEKDPEKAYQKNDARGLPTLMPFTFSGKRVTFKLRGAQKDLAKDESMITGWLRPQELVVNLKRILRACSER